MADVKQAKEPPPEGLLAFLVDTIRGAIARHYEREGWQERVTWCVEGTPEPSTRFGTVVIVGPLEQVRDVAAALRLLKVGIPQAQLDYLEELEKQ